MLFSPLPPLFSRTNNLNSFVKNQSYKPTFIFNNSLQFCYKNNNKLKGIKISFFKTSTIIMASLLSINKACFLVFCISFFVLFFHGSCTEFQVGETNGWGVPPPKEPNVYNEWASKKRFKVNDTLQFEYKKDSVMEVTEAEYEKCRSSAPIYFANKGDTTVQLNRSGLFYFISGVTGHCERGQKMIVKVLDVETPPDDDQQSPPANDNSNTPADDKNNKKNGATQVKFVGVTSMIVMVFGFLIMV